jgi:thiol-disulfide isomerase/thioredoxin
MKLSANDIVQKLLGLLLLAAAIMKGYELLTVPVANADIWSNRYFLIFTVEFELALGIWLLSGLFKRAAWLAALGCFGLFCAVTLYKGLAGYGSCGCFGRVQVSPWVTLFAVDLPAVVGLGMFRPQIDWQRMWRLPHWLEPAPNGTVLAVVFLLGLSAVGGTSPVLLFKAPGAVTAEYEILEPETWVGKELPILEYIDIGEQLKEGNWLVVLYHHDCPGCAEAIPTIEQMASDLQGNEDVLKIALIEVPPYRSDMTSSPVASDISCTTGKLSMSKKWFVTTPAMLLNSNGFVKHYWNSKEIDLELEEIVTFILIDMNLYQHNNFIRDTSLNR